MVFDASVRILCKPSKSITYLGGHPFAKSIKLVVINGAEWSIGLSKTNYVIVNVEMRKVS